MLGRPLGPLAVLCLAACGAGSAAPPAVVRAVEARVVDPTAPAPARLFPGSTEDAFWVTRAPELDRIVSGGGRLEINASGEVTDAVWDLALARSGDPLFGALAVPERLGGGFVHWTRDRVFRSRTFTGPLEPVALGAPDVTLLGARSGLGSVLVFTDGGPRELRPGATRLAALAEPGVSDAAALDASHAARLDVFGRVVSTDDGGQTSGDLTPFAGLGVQKLAVGEAELFLDTWQVRFVVRPGGRADPPDSGEHPSHESNRAYQIEWKGKSVDRDDLPYGLREQSPLSAAVAAGAAVGDGTAFAVVQGAVARVELASARILSLSSDWIPGGLVCQPLRAPDAVLFACVWEHFQSYGGYVLRSVAGAPPVLERAFSDDGSFVADDDGALGFLGSCRAEPRYFDAEEQARAGESNGADPPLSPVLCVRRGPGDWVERRVEVGDGLSLVGWAPRRDGTAAALAVSTDPLPPVASAGGRVTERGGVRLVRLYHDVADWQLTRRAWQPERGGLSGYVDRRFHARDDGSVDAWLSPREGSVLEATAVGVTFDPRGYPVVHEVVPGMIATVTGGSFGVAISRDGDLYETLDHGRTFRAAGKSPASPGAFAAPSCSALGCAFGPVTRLGWGDGHVAPRVLADPLPAPETPPPVPRLVCAPVGAPVPVALPPPVPEAARVTMTTGWGDTLELVHDASAPEPAAAAAAAAAAAPSPSSKRSRRPSPAVLRTHSLVWRPPFEPRAMPRRINATDAGFSVNRRSPVLPLLGPGGEVDLLVGGEQADLFVASDHLSSLATFEGRRTGRNDAPVSGGLATAAGHALVLEDLRRRLVLEDHAPGASMPPILMGPEHQPTRKRSLSLARRDDGALGALVLDGAAPETAGVALLDPAAASAGPVTRLAAWSTVTLGDDPRCRIAEREAWWALVVIDPTAWLALDPTALPGLTLAHEGMLLVRWGRERVCLEGLEAALVDQNRRGETRRSWSLSARWSGEGAKGAKGAKGAAVRTADAWQEVVCRVEAARRE